MKDPYETLGVPRDADEATIKAAYRRLSKEYHPDKGGDEDIFKEISAAWEVIGDPEARAHYDRTGTAPASQKGVPGEGIFLFVLDKVINEIADRGSQRDLIGTSILKSVRRTFEKSKLRVKDQIDQFQRRITVLEGQLGRYVATRDPATLEPYEEVNLFEHRLQAAIDRCSGAIAEGETELREVEAALIFCQRYEDTRPESIAIPAGMVGVEYIREFSRRNIFGGPFES